MRGRRKTRRARRRPILGWFTSLSDGQRRRILRGGGGLLLVTVFVAGLGLAIGRLEAHVGRKVTDRVDQVTLRFVDMPPQVADLAERELRAAVSHLLERDWTDERLCREVAESLSRVGWLAHVDYARRTGDGQLAISGHYRIPVAMVQYDSDFMLVDNQGVRVPGTYLFTPTWKLIQGVSGPPPEPGSKWDDEGIRPALDVIALLRREVYGPQITGILVGNIGARRDATRSHIELATDRAGGRIRWGSAPGYELEENSVEQKLAILAENFRQTGRADANHPIIDISTYPDRFTIPG